MNSLPLLAVSAVVPSLLLVWYFHRRDAFPEPGRVIWTTFALGILIIPGVLAVAVPIQLLFRPISNAYASGFLGALLVAAVPEEAFKLLVVRSYCSRHCEFDEPMDGVVYGAVASLGFATLENILYVADGGLGIAILRAFTAVPAHACMGAVMGYYVGRARFHPAERSRALWMAFFVPVVLHTLYDFPVLTMHALEERGLKPESAAPLLPITLAALVTLAVMARRGTRRARADQSLALAAGAAVPMADVLPNRPRPRGRAGGIVMLLLGFLLSAGGGLVALGVLAAIGTGQVPPEDRSSIFVGLAVIGILPLVAGSTLFAFGVRRLNRTAAAPSI